MKIYGYKITKKEWCSSEINSLTKYLNNTIGEYASSKDNIKYTNDYIAELIYLNCPDVTSLNQIESENIIAIMSIVIKYMYAYNQKKQSLLKSIKENGEDTKYSGIHYVLEHALFNKQLTENENNKVLDILSNKKSKKYLATSIEETKNLLEETNQLYLIPIFYDKVEPTFKKFLDNYNKKNNKR